MIFFVCVRNVLKMEDADSTEINPNTTHPGTKFLCTESTENTTRKYKKVLCTESKENTFRYLMNRPREYLPAEEPRQVTPKRKEGKEVAAQPNRRQMGCLK